MNNKEKPKRRELLVLGLITGAGVLTGVGTNKLLLRPENTKVKMITASGEVVEVDAKHLPPSIKKKPVSNAALKKWMEQERGNTF